MLFGNSISQRLARPPMQQDTGEDQPADQDAGRGQLLAEHGGADHEDRDQLALAMIA